jgi:hypothetical protein
MPLSNWRSPSSEADLPSDICLICCLHEGGAAKGSTSIESVGNSYLVHLAHVIQFVVLIVIA